MPENNTSILQELMENSSADVMTVIYNEVNSLLGAGNQLFAMEFPTRPLNAGTYEFNADDAYSVLTKPYPVQEAEFLLSDQLFDVSPIVQGPNGEKLSTVYTTVLNNLVPKLEALQGFVLDQRNLREWLMANVTDEVDGDRKDLSRMALAKELYGEFLKKRNEWYEKKNKKYDEFKKNDDLDGYARWLSSEGLVEEEEINNFYNDAVVRGNYHEVLTLLGFLNVSSPSEVLESSKQKMRASLRRSLDGSTDIYPVQFQPSDWFKALRPNMSPKDLTMATDSLLAEYRAKQARLRSLQALLAEQTVIEIPKEEQDRLNDDIANCEKKVRESEQALISQYGAGVTSAVKAVIDVYRANKEKDPIAKAKEVIQKVQGGDKSKFTKTEDRIAKLVEDIAADVVEGVSKSYAAQEKVLTELKNLTDKRMAYAEAKVKDMRLQKLRIEEQIKNVQADLDFLTPLVTGTIAEADKPKAGNEQDVLMTSPEAESEDNNFIDVIIKSDESGSLSSTSSSASSSQKSWGVGGWFWSGSHSQSESSSAQEQQKKEFNKKLEIGFRVKKVTFERGGWFNPNIMKLSDNYYKLADIRFSNGIHKDQVLSALNGRDTTAKLRELVTYTSTAGGHEKKLEFVLPAFPTGFVIAKDITIRIQSSKQESESSSKYLERNESGGGGFFCFRGNSSNSSKGTSESAYFGSSDKYFYIRIPGPQILGWFLEFTPIDNSEGYKKLDPKIYADKLKALLPDETPDDNEGEKQT